MKKSSWFYMFLGFVLALSGVYGVAMGADKIDIFTVSIMIVLMSILVEINEIEK